LQLCDSTVVTCGAAWFDRISARPAVQRGLDVPEPNSFKGEQSQEAIQKKIDDARKFMVRKSIVALLHRCILLYLGLLKVMLAPYYGGRHAT